MDFFVEGSSTFLKGRIHELRAQFKDTLGHVIQVLIRTRPINKAEMASQGFMRCLRQDSPQTITWLGQPESRFTFDHVAGDIVTQVISYSDSNTQDSMDLLTKF